MKIRSTWIENMTFESENKLDKKMNIDNHEATGGDDSAQTPMEAVLSALAACMGINIVKILRRFIDNLENLDFEMDGTQQEKWPRDFTDIHMTITIDSDLPKKQVKRAVELSHDKYCSVSNSLKADITYSIRLNGKDI